jgi:hypothetical protein
VNWLGVFKKRDKCFWLVALLASLVVHTLFCIQAYSAASQGGMVLNIFCSFLFYPHVILVFFLPPEYPFNLSGGTVVIDWLRFAGKLVVAYPASLLYGWLVSAIWHSLRRRKSS